MSESLVLRIEALERRQAEMDREIQDLLIALNRLVAEVKGLRLAAGRRGQ